MAYPIELSIGTGNKVTVNYQSQEVNVSLTYRLESGDSDALAVAREKATEVVAVHRAAWESVRGTKDGMGRRMNPDARGQEVISVSSPKPYRGAGAAEPQEDGPVGVDRATSLGLEASETIAAQSCLSEANPLEKPDAEALIASAESRDHAPSTVGQRVALRALLAQGGAGQEEAKGALITRYGCESLDDLSYPQACEWLLELQRAERERVRCHRAKQAC